VGEQLLKKGIIEPALEPLKEVEGVHMPHEKSFLFLTGEGHDEGAPRVGQLHEEELYGDLCAIHDHIPFSPIYLSVSTRVEFQRQVNWRLAQQFAYLPT
jgi:hypothetical protein